MPASRLVIMAVALAAAGGAGYLAMNWMTPPPPEVVEVAPTIETTEVLVMTGDVPMGQPLEGKIAWEQWPSGSVNEGFITKTGEPEAAEKFKNSLARVSLYGGEPVRKAKLVGEGLSFMSAILPSGRRAVATQIAADTSAGGFILPNDFVDVIMTRRKPAEGGAQQEGFITETILKNNKVLAIDQAIQEDEEGRRVKVGETATLELTPQQAEIITVAQQMADRLTLALRSVADTQEAPQEEADYLVSGNGKRGTIRLIKSGEVSEVGTRK
jgi:pilus assembly protein CpaB